MNGKKTLYRTLLILGLGLLALSLVLTALLGGRLPDAAGPWWASAPASPPWALPIC